MAVEFEKLQFKKNWNNASDFPTYEENEAQVRADLQALHDETKEFINDKLIPSIENLAVPGAGDMLAAIYDPNGKRKDVFQYAEDKAAAITRESLGAASAYSVSDHVANTSNPHRVSATQVPVSENVVSVLGNSGEWSVDDVLAQIGAMLNSGATLYQWRKSKAVAVITAESTTVSHSRYYYSENITIDGSGNITMVNPKQLIITSSTTASSVLATMGTSYFRPGSATGTNTKAIYKMKADTTATLTVDASISGWVAQLKNVDYYGGTILSELLVSEDPNAYTDGYVDDEGFTYTALETVSTFVPRMATGSYVGTGTSDIGNPNNLVLSFSPKLVWITGGGFKALFFASELTETYAECGYLLCSTSTLGTNAGYYALVDANTLKWYYGSTYANYQMNTSGQEYKWVAIG